MKKLVATLASVALVGGASYASNLYDINANNIAVSVNPIGILFGIGTVDVESQSTSYNGMVPLVSVSFVSLSSEDDKLTAVGTSFGFRIFSDKKTLSKWFVDFGVGIMSAKAENDTLNVSALGVIVSTYDIGGYRWLIGDGKWQIDLGLGISYLIGEIESSDGYYFEFIGLVPTGKFAVGYRF